MRGAIFSEWTMWSHSRSTYPTNHDITLVVGAGPLLLRLFLNRWVIWIVALSWWLRLFDLKLELWLFTILIGLKQWIFEQECGLLNTPENIEIFWSRWCYDLAHIDFARRRIARLRNIPYCSLTKHFIINRIGNLGCVLIIFSIFLITLSLNKTVVVSAYGGRPLLLVSVLVHRMVQQEALVRLWSELMRAIVVDRAATCSNCFGQLILDRSRILRARCNQ